MKGIVVKSGENTYQGIEDISDEYLKMLFKAIIEVDKQYYYTENPQNASNEIIEQLERIFAYELYHQWSILQEDYNRRVPEDYKRIINGEIGKQLLGVNKYPDMVLHKGHGDIHNQEIVIEIKRKAGLKDDNAIQDLIKLSNFMTKGFLGCSASPYKVGVFILTNGNEEDISSQLLNITNKKYLNNNIYCIFCKGDEKSLRYVTLNELL